MVGGGPGSPAKHLTKCWSALQDLLWRFRQRCAASATSPANHGLFLSMWEFDPLIPKLQLHKGFPGRGWGGKADTPLANQILLISSGIHAVTKSKNCILHCFRCHYLLSSVFNSQLRGPLYITSGKNLLIRVLFLLKIDVSSLVETMCRGKVPGPSPEGLQPWTTPPMEGKAPTSFKKKRLRWVQWGTGSRGRQSRMWWTRGRNHRTWRCGRLTV